MVKLFSKEVREPKEQNEVCKVEKSECKGVLGDHRNMKYPRVSEGGSSRIVNNFSVGYFGGILLHASTDIVSNDTSISWVGNESDSEESPRKFGDSRPGIKRAHQ